MKKIVISAVTAIFILGTSMSAFAKTTMQSTMQSIENVAAGNVEVDGAVGIATGPDSFDTGYGLTFGGGYTLKQINKNLQGRIDISYFNFTYKNNFYNSDLTYVRIPIVVSARYYFPVIEKLKVFGQAGIEFSADSAQYIDGAGNTHTKTELRPGITPGVGVDYTVYRNISVFGVGRWHIVTDNYVSLEFGAAYHF